MKRFIKLMLSPDEFKMVLDALRYYYLLTGANEKQPVESLLARLQR